jgi:hypothetical protein
MRFLCLLLLSITLKIGWAQVPDFSSNTSFDDTTDYYRGTGIFITLSKGADFIFAYTHSNFASERVDTIKGICMAKDSAYIFYTLYEDRGNNVPRITFYKKPLTMEAARLLLKLQSQFRPWHLGNDTVTRLVAPTMPHRFDILKPSAFRKVEWPANDERQNRELEKSRIVFLDFWNRHYK